MTNDEPTWYVIVEKEDFAKEDSPPGHLEYQLGNIDAMVEFCSNLKRDCQIEFADLDHAMAVYSKLRANWDICKLHLVGICNGHIVVARSEDFEEWGSRDE